MDDWPRYRALTVPEVGEGMRLDRFLARFFADRSRSWIARGIREGQVRDAGELPLRASLRVRAGQELRLYLPGIAPSGPPPPFPPVLHEDARLIAVDKPSGLLAHPTGTDFQWALVGLARQRWGDDGVDLVHRLDRDTSGVILLTRDLDANRQLKAALKAGRCVKVYEALVKGEVPWDERVLDGPIGSAGGVIRIQMGVREDGLPARTDVEVLARRDGMSWVRCRLHTGRTHQIRVHLAHAGFPLVGDRMYGVPPEVFLTTLDHGVTDEVVAAAGAPRHALHAAHVEVPHPDGGTLALHAPLAEDLRRWWERPEVLPYDR